MFAFHETTRKQLCRTAFLVLCVAPCAATALWIASHYLPGRNSRAARELGAVLDMHVKLADWRDPRPDMNRASRVALSDPQSGSPLAELADLAWRRGTGVRSCVIDRLSMEAAQCDELVAKLPRLLAKLPPERHDLRIATLTITPPHDAAATPHTAGKPWVFRDVRVQVDSDAAGRQRLQLLAPSPGSAAAAGRAVRITMIPAQDATSAAPVVTMETGPSPLPASLLAPFVPGWGRLGAEARFTGNVRWTLDAQSPQGATQGRLEGVDLAAIQPSGSPHQLQGAATIDLTELTWRAGRLQRLAGALRATDAQVSQSLVAALTRTFHCTLAEGATADPSTLVPLDSLAVQFELDGRGLTFWGDCPSEADGPPSCMATSAGRPLLFGPRYRDWPLGTLVQAFVAPSNVWVPATREAVDLAERLPLPLR